MSRLSPAQPQPQPQPLPLPLPPPAHAGDGRHRATRCAAAALLLSATAALALPPAAANAAGGRWSTPATLTSCPGAAEPRAVFPSSDPRTSSGPGAILWSGDCAPGTPVQAGIGFANVAADDVVGPALPLPQAISPATQLGSLAGVAGTGDGRLVVTAGLGIARDGQLAILEGRSGASLGAAVALGAQPVPVATATSYVGDVAVASVRAGTGRVILRLQRHASPGLSPPIPISGRAAPVTGLAVGLDYRGDALVVWAQRGWIYRRVLQVNGRLQAIERVAQSPPAPHLQALISDDNRGIVAWSTDGPATGVETTRIYLDASLRGVHFTRPPRLLEQFADPPGVHLPDGSLRMVRLANEGVLIAWTGLQAGHFVIRAASVSLAAPRPVSLVSDAGVDSVLDDLATGPHSEAIALWSTAPRTDTGFDPHREQIVGARGVVEAPGLADFAAPEQIAGPGPLATPRAAFDPTTDTAVAVWTDVGRGLDYATRDPAAPPDPSAHGSIGWRGWAAGATGLLGLVCVGLGARGLRGRRRGMFGARRRRRFKARPTR